MDKTPEEIVKEMQEVADQMVKDDLDENPDMADEFFDCDCCGETKCLAGSIEYEGYRLCNDCVLLAETGFALKKFDSVEDLIKAIEDKNLERLCDFVKQEELRKNN